MLVSKLVILLAVMGLFGLVGFKEYQSVCLPKQQASDSHGHGAEGASHDADGLLTTICEDGLLTAIKEKFGLAAHSPAEPRVANTDGHKSGDGHPHGEMTPTAVPEKKENGKKNDDGHGHAAGEPGKSENAGKKDEHDHGSDAEGGRGAKKDEHGHGAEGGEGFVKLTATQMAAAGIETAPVASGTLSKEITVPGRILINANLQAKVVPRLAGTASKVFKQAGDSVAEGEVLAMLESREMADAKGEYLAARRAEELAKATFVREERLWKKKVTAEQDYLTAKNTHQEAVIKRDLAHQKLHTISMSEDDIAEFVKSGNNENYRFYELKSPIKGRIIARDLIVGQIVSTDREVFSIADLSRVWVEIAVSPADLAFAKDGQDVRIQSGVKTATAKVIAVNPSIDAETRTAKVVAELANEASDWRLGDFVNAQLLSGKLEVNLMVPRDAIQTIKGAKAVFVNEGGGFRMRPVTTGREDTNNVEILSGLEFGETIATKNTFTIKAELGKAEAEHEH